ncbi:MAG: hypothetical protein ACREP3_13750 [Candidatus Binatia bacterium]
MPAKSIASVTAAGNAARLGDDFLHALVEVERPVDARLVALGDQS